MASKKDMTPSKKLEESESCAEDSLNHESARNGIIGVGFWATADSYFTGSMLELLKFLFFSNNLDQVIDLT